MAREQPFVSALLDVCSLHYVLVFATSPSGFCHVALLRMDCFTHKSLTSIFDTSSPAKLFLHKQSLFSACKYFCAWKLIESRGSLQPQHLSLNLRASFLSGARLSPA